MSSDTMPMYAALARALAATGTKTLYGLLGDGNLFFGNAFVCNEGGRFVPATLESHAVQMALGHASMSGRAAVATVTYGAAVVNALTPLVDGVKGQTPIVLMAGETSPMDPLHHHAIAQRALIEATGAGFLRIRAPETAAEDLYSAFRRAATERRPVVLSMPSNLMWSPVPVPDMPGGLTPPEPGAPDPVALDAAAEILASARHPVVVAGNGALHAPYALIELAEATGAHLATTLKAKALFDGHPNNIGVIGGLATPLAVAALERADVIVAFGASLNRHTTSHGRLLCGSRIVQIDSSAYRLRRLAKVDCGLVGDARLAAQQLVERLRSAGKAPSRPAPLPEGLPVIAPEAEPRVPSADGTIDLTIALRRIDAAMPRDRILVTDGGRFMITAWRELSVSGPDNFLTTTNAGGIGMGMGNSIGAAIARPDQRVLFVTGDGGFMMGGLSEFPTAVNEALDLVVVVCNDQAYGAEYIQLEERQMDPAISTFSWPSLAVAAVALGGRGVQVRDVSDLEQAVVAIKEGRGPLLLELMLDPAAVPPIVR